jgi:hypothetical protein
MAATGEVPEGVARVEGYRTVDHAACAVDAGSEEQRKGILRHHGRVRGLQRGGRAQRARRVVYAPQGVVQLAEVLSRWRVVGLAYEREVEFLFRVAPRAEALGQ